jgi:hypothetical protein
MYKNDVVYRVKKCEDAITFLVRVGKNGETTFVKKRQSEQDMTHMFGVCDMAENRLLLLDMYVKKTKRDYPLPCKCNVSVTPSTDVDNIVRDNVMVTFNVPTNELADSSTQHSIYMCSLVSSEVSVQVDRNTHKSSYDVVNSYAGKFYIYKNVGKSTSVKLPSLVPQVDKNGMAFFQNHGNYKMSKDSQLLYELYCESNDSESANPSIDTRIYMLPGNEDDRCVDIGFLHEKQLMDEKRAKHFMWTHPIDIRCSLTLGDTADAKKGIYTVTIICEAHYVLIPKHHNPVEMVQYVKCDIPDNKVKE